MGTKQRATSSYSNTLYKWRVAYYLSPLLAPQPLQSLVRHHIESFNFMLEEGLSHAVKVGMHLYMYMYMCLLLGTYTNTVSACVSPREVVLHAHYLVTCL